MQQPQMKQSRDHAVFIEKRRLRAAHRRPDGVRNPQGHEAVLAVSVEVVGMVKKTKGGARLDDSGVAKGMVEVT